MPPDSSGRDVDVIPRCMGRLCPKQYCSAGQDDTILIFVTFFDRWDVVSLGNLPRSHTANECLTKQIEPWFLSPAVDCTAKRTGQRCSLRLSCVHKSWGRLGYSWVLIHPCSVNIILASKQGTHLCTCYSAFSASTSLSSVRGKSRRVFWVV